MFGLDKKDEPVEENTAVNDNSGVTVTPQQDDDDSVNVTVLPPSDSTPSESDTSQGQPIEVATPPTFNSPAVAPAEESSEGTGEMPSPSEEATAPETEAPAPTEEPLPEMHSDSEEVDEELPSTVSFPPDEPKEEDTDQPADASNDSVTPSETPSDLKDLKSATLKELAPLVSHLDMSPEEKLKTVMELYEASKDQSLLKAAHDAAVALPDDTARAKALLDLVHKIDELA